MKRSFLLLGALFCVSTVAHGATISKREQDIVSSANEITLCGQIVSIIVNNDGRIVRSLDAIPVVMRDLRQEAAMPVKKLAAHLKQVFPNNNSDDLQIANLMFSNVSGNQLFQGIDLQRNACRLLLWALHSEDLVHVETKRLLRIFARALRANLDPQPDGTTDSGSLTYRHA
jgi:hypothetical protein